LTSKSLTMRLRRGTLMRPIEPIVQDLLHDQQEYQLSVSYSITICSYTTYDNVFNNLL
jgi:hypothetical protein